MKLGRSSGESPSSSWERQTDYCFYFGCVSSNDDKRVYNRLSRLQREHIFKDFYSLTREWAKWESEHVNKVSEQNEQSEQCEGINIASDQMPHSKRDCLRLETRPSFLPT